ncbi:MAG TPA: hypothetical protein V6D50_19400 [Chroococcales cyanobacterium]
MRNERYAARWRVISNSDPYNWIDKKVGKIGNHGTQQTLAIAFTPNGFYCRFASCTYCD